MLNIFDSRRLLAGSDCGRWLTLAVCDVNNPRGVQVRRADAGFAATFFALASTS